MMIEISVQNGISKYLQSLIRNSPDFVRGCSKSMGYFVPVSYTHLTLPTIA